MHTVREVADRYGVTTKFLTLALEKIGYHLAEPDQPLSAATVARFESADAARQKRRESGRKRQEQVAKGKTFRYHVVRF